MKVVILAGGFGTRISEESQFKPKPMVELGGMPIMWHIMKLYSHYGYNEFVICAGYKQEVIKDYFASYFLHRSDVTFDFSGEGNEGGWCQGGRMTVHHQHAEPWKVTVVDTGLNTMTGGRVRRVKEYLGDEPFFLTYGDGVGNVDIAALLKFHKSHGKLITMTSVNPGQRFGSLDIADDGHVAAFREKAKRDGFWINGGFMVCEPAFIDLIEGDDTVFEKKPLETAANNGQLMAYRHEGFWQQMDTVAERQLLEKLWASGEAPWKVW